jgi:glycosyltransferase involved in cell wall biosynthesis
MLLGCPVIATRSTAVPEVCGDAALYADPDDPETWEEHILLIKTDPEIRAAMKASGLQQTSKFTWAASTEALLNVATNALEEGL